MYIGDISPPRGVKAAMEMQAEAERKKRAQIESEGNKISTKVIFLNLQFDNVQHIIIISLIVSLEWVNMHVNDCQYL